MKRALTIATALSHRPQLVFLDEPTTGLDVISARNLRQMITSLRDEGVTVFLTTHYLEEAERLCDQIAIIVAGKIVALDSPDNLKKKAQEKTTLEIILEDKNGNLATERTHTASPRFIDRHRRNAHHTDNGVEIAVHQVSDRIGDRWVVAINTIRPSLEDVFVKLTGLSPEVMLLDKGGKGNTNASG